jgi:cytochrome b561
MKTGWKNTEAGYGWLSISLHWLMLLLIAAAYVTIELKPVFPRGSPAREVTVLAHYFLGLSIFALVWLRLGVRMLGVRPAISPALPAGQAAWAKTMHWLLYALMLVLPLSGWLLISAKGIAVPIFDMELPALIGKSKEVAKGFREIHNAVATTGYVLIGLHAAAGIFHHYARRDNSLKLMLPLLRHH